MPSATARVRLAWAGWLGTISWAVVCAHAVRRCSLGGQLSALLAIVRTTLQRSARPITRSCLYPSCAAAGAKKLGQVLSMKGRSSSRDREGSDTSSAQPSPVL